MSKKVAVVYKSKYGSTKRYAEWIAEELKADLFEASKINLNGLQKYDTIIYGGSLYAVGIYGFSLIKKNFDQLKDKKIIVCSVGASPAHAEAIENIRKHNFTDEMKEKVQHFHLRGGFDYKKMNLLHKFMMSIMKKSIEKKKGELTEDERGLLECFSNPVDWTNKEAIKPIIECVNS